MYPASYQRSDNRRKASNKQIRIGDGERSEGVKDAVRSSPLCPAFAFMCAFVFDALYMRVPIIFLPTCYLVEIDCLGVYTFTLATILHIFVLKALYVYL